MPFNAVQCCIGRVSFTKLFVKNNIEEELLRCSKCLLGIAQTTTAGKIATKKIGDDEWVTRGGIECSRGEAGVVRAGYHAMDVCC